MATPCKKSKAGTGAENAYIRVCDAFVRTVGGVICPLQKTEESVRVLFKLQRELLQTVIKESAKKAGLRLGPMEWVPAADSDQLNDGNIFMECLPARGDDAFEKFKNHVTAELKQQFNVKNILIEKLETKHTIPQPLISEGDFDMYKLKLCYEMLSKAAGDDPENELDAIAGHIKGLLEDLKENRVKIGILSQNGKGKSFFLNLLFLLTADTEEEYKENNKDIKLPKDIENDSTIKELNDEEMKILPQVIQDVVTKIRKNEDNENNEEHLKSFAESFVHTLTCPIVEDKSLSEIKNYFTGGRADFEYILAQKQLAGCCYSTTKCNIHMRYAPLYQMRVEYFSAEDLQSQLFQLKSLTKEETSDRDDSIFSKRKKRSCETLKARLALLTDLIDDDDDDDDEKVKKVAQSWKSTEDIKLSRDVRKYAGSIEMYVGNGMNATSDRLALKEVLKTLTTSQEKTEQERQQCRTKLAAIKKIVVYLPSKILMGNEILEMPGTDESDPMAVDYITRALEKVDIVFLLSESAFNIGENEVKEILAESNFFRQMLMQPSNYELMLLSYSEKQSFCQFQKKNGDKIKNMEKEEDRKRNEEIKALEKMIKDKKLPGTLSKQSIYTSFILPVLHTSIHSQEGVCHEIIEECKHFLKHTGITKLMTELDKFATEKQKDSVLEIHGDLDELLNRADGELDVENAKSIVRMFLKKEMKSMHEADLASKNEKLLTELGKSLKDTLSSFINEQISPLLISSIEDAEQRWNNNEEKIKSTAIFTPRFNGKHPAYKVKIYDIIFEGLLKDAKEYFPILINKLEEKLAEYEKESINLLTTKLDSLLPNRRASTQQFVERTVKQSLCNALSWYMGKTQFPFNEKRLEKYFQQSQNMSLRDKIVKTELETKDISEAKKIMKDGINKTIWQVAEEFAKLLFFKLHKNRFKSLCGKLKERKGDKLRMWQILMGKIRSISRDRERNPQVDDIKKALNLMSVNLRDIPE